MSASNTPINSPVPTQDKVEKKPRAPILPAKFSKFIHFGYWFMNQLNDDPDAPAVDEALFVEKLNLFADVESQQTFVQSFFDDAKDVNQTIRGLVKQKNKDLVKAAKAAAKPVKEKVPRKKNDKKVKESSTEDSFVNEMVQLANGDLPSDNPPPSKVDKVEPDKVVKEPKVKADKADKEPKVKESKVKADKVKESKGDKVKETKVKETKVKESKVKESKVKETKVKETKADKVKEPKADKAKAKNSKANSDYNPDSPDDLTQVSILNLNGLQYLIDDNNLVYHFQNHSLLGSFDPINNAII